MSILTPQIIMSHGFTGKRVGEILKNSKVLAIQQG